MFSPRVVTARPTELTEEKITVLMSARSCYVVHKNDAFPGIKRARGQMRSAQSIIYFLEQYHPPPGGISGTSGNERFHKTSLVLLISTSSGRVLLVGSGHRGRGLICAERAPRHSACGGREGK